MKADITDEGDPESAKVNNESKHAKHLLKDLTATLTVRAERIRLQQKTERLQRQDDIGLVQHNMVNVGLERQWQSSTSQIPVSQARLRHRRHQKDGQVNIRGGTNRPHVDISRYRPDYTWNRGGRVKELRFRTLARKFLNIWKKNVFGRVLLSQASAHYSHTLLSRTFSVWHLYWWELRKEWRLMVRAECHHRYVLWLTVFRAWKDFVLLRTVKAAKVDRANNHYNKTLLVKVLKGWKCYWRERRRKIALQRKADQRFSEKAVRRYWLRWKEGLEQVEVVQQMDHAALQFWAERMQAQHWLIWRSVWKMAQDDKRQLAEAERFRHRVVAAKCLGGWKLYWRNRQTKKRYKEYAGQVYGTSLKLQMFCHWRKLWLVRKACTQHQEEIALLKKHFQTRRFFCQWQNYIADVNFEKQRLYQADIHYQRHLLRLGLNAFRLSAVQRRIKVMRQNLADQLHHKQVERWAFTIWSEHMEAREEHSQRFLTIKAGKHYGKVILSKAFKQLHEYRKWRKYRKSQYVKADTHYYMSIVPYCLLQMNVFVQKEKTYRLNCQKADEFRREALLWTALSTWTKEHSHSKDVRLMLRMAILHRENVLVHSFFCRWKTAVAIQLQETEKEAEADQHHHTTLCRSHLLAWHGHVRGLRKEVEDEVKSLRHSYHALLKKCLASWKKYVKEQRQKQALKKRAELHLRKKLYVKSLVAWKRFVQHRRVATAAAEVKYRATCSRTLRWSFITWQRNCKIQSSKMKLEKAAGIHFNRQLLAKVLQSWRRYAAIHAYKKSQTKQMVEDAKEQLEKCKLKIYLGKWQQSRETAIIQRLKEERAAVHYSHRLLKTALYQWRQFRSLAIRQQLLRRQSTWFLSVRLTAKYFLTWKRGLVAQTEEKQKTTLALWHWSLVLQRKTLQVWYLYKCERQRKRQRCALALESRRSRLVRDGVSQWLRVAAALADTRAKMAAQQQLQSASTQYQRIYRCAQHWRAWATRRARSRSQERRLPDPFPVLPGARVALGEATQPGSLPVLQAALFSPVKLMKAVASVGTCGVEAGRKERAKPRHPAFLAESLQRAGLLTIQQYESIHPSSLQITGTDISHHDQVQPLQDGRHRVPAAANATALGGSFADKQAGVLQSDSAMNALTVGGESDLHRANPPCSSVIAEQSVFPTATSTFKVHSQLNSKQLKRVSPSQSSSTDSVTIRCAGETLSSPSDTLVLMKPQDFLKRRDGTDFSLAALVKTGSDAKTSRVRGSSVGDHKVFSGTQRIQIIPVLRGSAENGDGDNNGSTSTPQNIQNSASLTTAASTLASTAAELTNIRDTLKHFKENRKKLRHLEKQQEQLSSWLQNHQESGDNYTTQVTDELTAIQQEVMSLKAEVASQKVSCEQLVNRAKILTEQLGVAP